jgi:hypothetical protein
MGAEMSDDQNEDDDDRELTEEEENEARKGLFYRWAAENDFQSPRGVFTEHDSLRCLTGALGLRSRDGEDWRDDANRLHDIVEDHERLLRLAVWMRDLLAYEAQRLDGPAALLNCGKVRAELQAALVTLNSEMSRLYLDKI